MSKLLFLFAFLSVFQISLTAQYVQKEEMESDIKEFEETLFKLHPGLNYHTSTETLESIFAEIKTDLPDSLSLAEFFTLIEPVIDTIKCGHTNLTYGHKLFKDKEERKKKTLFPAGLTLFENRLFLTGEFKNKRIDLPKGTEIIRLDDRPVAEIIYEMARFQKGADGDNSQAEKNWGIAGFQPNYARLYGLKERHKILVQKPNKEELDLYTVYSISYADYLKQFKETKPEILDLTFSDDNIATIKYTTFSNESLFKKSRKKIKRAFKEIKEKGSDKLIIDLRNNGGGAIANVNHMLSYLLKDKFKIVEEASLNTQIDKKDLNIFHKVLIAKSKKVLVDDKIILKNYGQKGKKGKDNYSYDGKLVLLINERSYSAATMFSAIVEHKKRGTLIGSESGGSYYISFAGFSKFLKLKHSEIRIRIPLLRLVYNVTTGAQKKNLGIVPKIEKKPKYEDLLDDEVDSVKDFALDHLRKLR